MHEIDVFAGSIAVPGLGDLLGQLAAPLLQQQRLLQVDTALPGTSFVAEQARVHEAVNEPFEIDLTVLATSAFFDLHALLGEQITLRLLQPDGSYRPWHGYVLQASQLGADGGLARYRLVMRPWLSLLAHREDSFVYQDRSALQIVEEVFRDYPQAHWRTEVSETLRERSLCIQYRESDLAFVSRLLAEEGLSYHVEHLSGDAAVAADQRGQARHCLVITDRFATRAHAGSLRFAAPRDSASRLDATRVDTLTRFAARRAVTPNAATRAAWDYQRVAGVAGQDSADPGAHLPPLEHYDGAGAYRYEHGEHAARAATLALGAHTQHALRFDGEGSVRSLAAGQNFTLLEHPSLNGSYTTLALQLQAVNNLGAQAAHLMQRGALDKGQCQLRLQAQPAGVPVLPALLRRPTAPGAQSALVVGLSNEPLTTERDLRVKLQFPWQRGQRPNAGGLAHDERSADAQGNAPGDETSGTWVRVAQRAAGANWGAVFVPRIGTEVLVDFVEGDIDRPIVVGQLHNGQDTPPFAAGVGSGVNHPGVIDGVHSPTLDRAGYNEWAIDNATGQLRMRLLSSYTLSELGLGHLIQQQPASAQRGSARGAGFELGTQGWGSLRAAQGLFISTTARPGTYGSAHSTQMDAAESLAQLKAAHDLGQRLSEPARTLKAQGLTAHDARASVATLIKSLDPQQDGKFDGSVNGQEAKKADANRQLGDAVERPATPTVVLDAAHSLAQVSEAGIAGFAGQDNACIAQGDWQETAAHTHSLVAGRTASWYVHEQGIQLKAANGPVSVRAHTDRLEILADQAVQVLSVNDEITVTAATRIELVGGDSSVTLDGSDITFKTPGSFTVKAAQHVWEGGASAAADVPALPAGTTTEPPRQIELHHHYDDLSPVAGASYKVCFDDGTVLTGDLDAQGYKLLTGVPPGPYIVQFGESSVPWQAPPLPPDTARYRNPDVQAEGRRLLLAGRNGDKA